MDNLWSDVGNKCLACAKAILDGEAVPTVATVETAQRLVDMAIQIDMLNLRWAEQSRSGAAVFSGRPSSRPAEEN